MRKQRSAALIFTCEHAGADIPKPLFPYFKGHEKVLKTHRACDFGALPIAKALAKYFSRPLFFTKTSRLVVDCNRSIRHRGVISSFLDKLSEKERQQLLRRYYLPYRGEVEESIHRLVQQGHRVLHISVHSFTPVLNGEKRTAEIGLLFDPRRSHERELCLRWQKVLQQRAPQWRVRRNYPYRGVADGFTTYLRRKFTEREYVGIEIELNQALVGEHTQKPPSEMMQLLKKSLEEVLKK